MSLNTLVYKYQLLLDLVEVAGEGAEERLELAEVLITLLAVSKRSGGGDNEGNVALAGDISLRGRVGDPRSSFLSTRATVQK